MRLPRVTRTDGRFLKEMERMLCTTGFTAKTAEELFGLLRNAAVKQRERQKFQSIRPIPASAHSWNYFPHQRGDILEFSLTPFSGASPHVEDRVSMRDFRKTAAVAEPEVASYLGKAECSDSLRGLFECAIHENRQGSGVYALRPRPGARSAVATRRISGWSFTGMSCEPRWCSFQVKSRGTCPWLTAIGWTLRMPRRIAGRIAPQSHRSHLSPTSQYRIMSCPHHFVRIGLTRPYREVCWLMLDTLFSIPKADWLEEF